MGIYNLLTCETQCPHCASVGDVEVQTYFGLLNLLDYEIGDEVAWTRKVSTKKGGRSKDGDLDGEGYAECPSCGRDYFLVVEVRHDRITAARVDPAKPGYMAQAETMKEDEE